MRIRPHPLLQIGDPTLSSSSTASLIASSRLTFRWIRMLSHS